MAHTKSLGTSKNLRESASQRLGVKKNHGQKIMAGQIIIRQRGSKYIAGANVGKGSDDTLYALKNGAVRMKQSKKIRFDGTRRLTTVVEVLAA